jgi:hypothetical protein
LLMMAAVGSHPTEGMNHRGDGRGSLHAVVSHFRMNFGAV